MTLLGLGDGVSGRVLQQVIGIVVVDLHVGDKHGIAAVLIHHTLYPTGLRDAKQVTIVWLLCPKINYNKNALGQLLLKWHFCDF